MIRSPENPGHLIPPRQLEGSRCALRDESTDTRINYFRCAPESPQGALPPLGCVDDAYEPVTSMYTVSPHGARRLGVVIAQSVGNVEGSSG
jgi:hypothetical protein